MGEAKTNNHKYFLRTLLVLGAVFFFIYSFLPVAGGLIFNSPDENANFIFTKNLIERGDLKIFEPLNREVGNIVHPRSTNVAGPFIVPGSFLGLILIYGLLGKIFSLEVVTYFTPLAAVAGVLFFYGLTRKVFNSTIAFISSLLLFIHPAWWYWSSRTMMPNVLFISLLLGGFYLMSRIKKDSKWSLYFFAGIFLGLALSVRLSEFWWLIIAPAMLIFIYRREMKWPYVVLGFGGLLLSLVPVFYYQYLTYGNALLTGYSQLGSDVASNLTQGSGSWLDIIFRFGIHPRLMVKNCWNYLILIFWWFTPLFLAGLGFFIYRYRDWQKKQKVFFWLWFFISAWLVVYYGSWFFYDNPTPGTVTIGTSYVRYWLPIYLGLLPFVSLLIIKAGGLVKNKASRILIVVIFILALAYPSARLVLWQTEESVFQVRHTLEIYGQVKEKIIENTEEDSVIVASYMDKILFPERRVVQNIADDYTEENLSALLDKAPVYVYSLFSEKDVNFLNDKKLSRFNLVLSAYQDLPNGAKLMKLMKK
ncbi:MAG: glycosyltransferase family 39 protein [Patescibacteria group bacterium]|nr:glycosyltransferase family 39 protein [Patescibacteria group bacterium]MDD5490724.1 glycosyltransferase family 39 protein [Patescibacteria group bacterium]